MVILLLTSAISNIAVFAPVVAFIRTAPPTVLFTTSVGATSISSPAAFTPVTAALTSPSTPKVLFTSAAIVTFPVTLAVAKAAVFEPVSAVMRTAPPIKLWTTCVAARSVSVPATTPVTAATTSPATLRLLPMPASIVMPPFTSVRLRVAAFEPLVAVMETAPLIRLSDTRVGDIR